MKTHVVAMIHGRHPSATSFNARVTKLMEDRHLVVKELTDEAMLKYKEAGRTYEYKVVNAATEPYLPKVVKESLPVRVVRKWTNRSAWRAISEYYGHAVTLAPETEYSPVYYRVSDVVVTHGEGAPVIKQHAMVNDDAWQSLLAGQLEPYLLNHVA